MGKLRISYVETLILFERIGQIPALWCLAHMSAGSSILVGFSVDTVSHLGPRNPVFLVALIPCWTFWVTHRGLPLLQLTAPSPLMLHHSICKLLLVIGRRFFSDCAVRNVTKQVGHIPTKLDSDNESLGATSVMARPSRASEAFDIIQI